jgi:hypothetical protein
VRHGGALDAPGRFFGLLRHAFGVR